MSKTANEIIEAEILPLVKDGDWENPKAGEEHYSTNQIIAAFEAGVAKGISDTQALKNEKFLSNYKRSGADTWKLINKLQEYSLKPTTARLKIIAWNRFEVLITLPEKEYLGKKFENVYDFTGELENASRRDHYCIAFCFCPEVDGLDEQKIKSDGFTIHHKSLMPQEPIKK